MADPEIPVQGKLKRKQCTTTFFDPDEMAEMIVDELEKAREGIDKKLAKYSDAFLQAQSKKRQRFINYCESEILALPDDMRSSVATRLLSSEEFAMKMNFSELHTSSAKSHLTWSCGDTSLSEPSWRKLLQQYVGGAAESSPPSIRELARGIRAKRKSSSPPAPPSLPTTVPVGLSTSTTLAEDEEDPITVPEDQDILSTSHVTIPKARTKMNMGHQVAPPGHEAQPRKGPQGLFGKGIRLWTEEEIDTLRSLCAGKPEAMREKRDPFWESVQAQMPGRSPGACFGKWRAIHGVKGGRKPWKKGSDAPRTRRKLWSQKELTLLEQLRPRPGEPIDRDRLLTSFPDRTASSIISTSRHKFGKLRLSSKAHSSGLPKTAADEVSGGLVNGDRAEKEYGNETETVSNGGGS